MRPQVPPTHGSICRRRRSGWLGCSPISCRPRRRFAVCWPCCCSHTLVVVPGRQTTGRRCRSQFRTAASGTPISSPRGSGLSAQPPLKWALAPTPFRLRLRPCTPKRRISQTRTGRRFSCSTACSPTSTRPRWSRSTPRSRSGRSRAPRRPCALSTSSVRAPAAQAQAIPHRAGDHAVRTRTSRRSRGGVCGRTRVPGQQCRIRLHLCPGRRSLSVTRAGLSRGGRPHAAVHLTAGIRRRSG